jgi:sulfur carrier protein
MADSLMPESSPGTAPSAPVNHVTANGRRLPWPTPSTLESFLVAQGLLPRSVVVEHNGEAVAPSEFAERKVCPGDRLEIVRIVAGG